MDFSPLIACTVPIAGLAIAFIWGSRRAGRGTRSSVGAALLFAIVLGIALTFAQSFLHTMCIETWRQCKSRGDGNMSYWFQSFFASPLFCLVAWIASRARQ